MSDRCRSPESRTVDGECGGGRWWRGLSSGRLQHIGWCGHTGASSSDRGFITTIIEFSTALSSEKHPMFLPRTPRLPHLHFLLGFSIIPRESRRRFTGMANEHTAASSKRVFPPLYVSSGDTAQDRLAFFHVLERLKVCHVVTHLFQKRISYLDRLRKGPAGSTIK